MDEQTGTDEALFEASDVEPVANGTTTEQADNSTSSAVEATNEQTDSKNEATDEPAVSTQDTQTGDAIDEFLAKKGIDKSDPDALRKVADMYRNSEKGFYGKSQEVAQLQRQLAQTQAQDTAPSQEALSEVRALRIQMETDKWKAEHNLSAEDEQKMIDYVQRPLTDSLGKIVINPITGQPYTKAFLVNNGAMSLDDVYRLAGCGDQLKVDNLKENYRKEVEKEMAARQAAKRPSANATNSTQFSKPDENDPFLAGLMDE